MAGNISWKEFEAIVTRLQRMFAKDGKVTQDEKLAGRNSGQKRQIDIVIRAKVGVEDILIIAECKKWNRRPDVKAIEAFAGVKEDGGAHVGMMISTIGFTKAAHRTAQAKNISLYRHEDTLTEGWPAGIETNVLMEIWEITPTDAAYILNDGTEERIASDEGITLIDIKSLEEGSIASFLRKVWDQLPPEEKYDRSWAFQCDCTGPERPEIQQIVLGATSKFIRGYRAGRLQFEGLLDESKGHANVGGWKMVFGGDFTPLLKSSPPPHSKTLSVRLKTTHVKTSDPKSEKMAELLHNGVLELSVAHQSVTELPISLPFQKLAIGHQNQSNTPKMLL